ncbi:flavin reductase family protein [Kangiella geojedonensis]|uniref:Dim6/ntab family protein n=1 Tax=Kangiella geojedonensis TaxID=914150 RepID=A0A0F6TQL8_9GAMM|nr:flavin reductase [Kangiella geojedonensis]AKE51809.1 Dim6/ntab family protein [Kangiella geojedonensis]
MMLSAGAIQNLDRKFRLNLINSITGVKPANMIGTVSSDGETNLAIISSVVHLGSDPALVGFVTRPTEEIPRHTYQNILDTTYFTINHVSAEYIKNAHYTSTKFPREISEFKECGFSEEYLDDFKAPFVKESLIKIGVKYRQQLPIELNGTRLMIGEIQTIIFPDDAVNEKGYMDLEGFNNVGIGGLNQYYSLKKIGEFPYARLGDEPDFD